jgi:peptidoglycan hydrolase-like protein with peptidoglycan-binding domain
MRKYFLSCGFALLVSLVLATGASAMGKSRTAALQIGLHAKGTYRGTIDGIWGPATERAVRDLQRKAKIPVDGVPGRQTRRALGRYGRPGFGTRVIRSGQVGWDVSQLQFLLAWHGFPSGPLDGAFGPRTAAAVRGFQRWAGIGVDGVPGPATLRALRGPLPRAGVRLAWPVVIPPTDGFGPRGNRFHTGLDFPARHGVPVAAAAAGRVAFAGRDGGGYGNLVVVRHAGGVYTWYAHLAAITVRRGAFVGAGARIGTVGATGHATGPHLHFEVRVRGAATDPLAALG